MKNSLHHHPLRVWALIVLALLLTTQAPAQAMSIRQLKAVAAQEPNGPLFVQYYLIGVLEGLIESNTHQQRQPMWYGHGKAADWLRPKPLFCVLQNDFSPDQAQPMYIAELARLAHVYEADMPVELVMRNALQHIAPCVDPR